MLHSGDAVDRTAVDAIIVTCAVDCRAHAVPDSEFTSAALDSGRFPTLCGSVISAAPLAEPDGEPCPQCMELTRPVGPRRSRGLRRLL